jgi:xanthine/uracil/vitamin C permease (AzgA family)
MLSEYLELSKKHTSLKIELVAGLTTFLTIAYIIAALSITFLAIDSLGNITEYLRTLFD